MNHFELLRVTGMFVVTLVTFLGFGRALLWRKDEHLEDYGVYLVVGLMSYGYSTLLLGILHQLTAQNLLFALAGFFVAGIWRFKLPIIKVNLTWLGAGLSLISAIMLGTLYLTSLQPPHTSDELNYHFPEAQQMVDRRQIDLHFGGQFFYGNIPKQMEVLYAAGIAIYGYAYAHTLHFMFFLALLLAVAGIFNRQYGGRVAALSVFLLLMYDDLTWNVASGFVDGAAFCLEIMGLLFALQYLTSKKRDLRALIYSGLMIGAGLAIKYSVAVTGAYIFVLLLPQWKKLIRFVGPGLVAGGFWYFKNLLWFGNPFYPLYLGHPGVSEAEYQGLLSAIQQFGPKTWAYCWQLLGYFREIPRLPVYLSLFAAPLSIFVKKGATFTRLLLWYFLLYVPYWFFLGTHQMRFFAPAAMAALLLTSIVVGRLSVKWIVAGLVILTIWMWRTPYFDQNVASFFWSTKFHLTERQYALGHLTQDQFMYRWYGCYYDAVEYINTLPPGAVVDNWSYGIEFNLPFYSQHHTYIQWTRTDRAAMSAAGIKYLYIRDTDVSAYRTRTEPSFGLAIPSYTIFDNFFESQATLIKQIDDCRVYALTP